MDSSHADGPRDALHDPSTGNQSDNSQHPPQQTAVDAPSQASSSPSSSTNQTLPSEHLTDVGNDNGGQLGGDTITGGSTSMAPPNLSVLKNRFPSVPSSPSLARTADAPIPRSHPADGAPQAQSIAHTSPSVGSIKSVRSTQSAPAGDVDKTPTLDIPHRANPADAFMLPEAALRPPRQHDVDTESNRLSFSSLYSLGSAIVSGARGFASSGPSSIAESDIEVPAQTRSDNLSPSTAHASIANGAPHHGVLGASPQSVSSMEHPATGLRPALNHSQTSLPRSTGHGRHGHHTSTRARSKTRDSRRVSRNTNASNASPASDRPHTRESTEKRKAPGGVIGVCALDSKARSKPSRNILNRLIANGDFDVIIFGDKIILDEDVENWPVCDYLISFFSEGFPLEKAIAYERLRRPFCVNDLPMQTVLWDRRLCLMVLDSFNIPTPKRIEVSRDGGPKLATPDLAAHFQERTGLKLPGVFSEGEGTTPRPKLVEAAEDDDVLIVDGVELRKPFVEKPVSGEDHNIHIYFPSSAGGGGRRLFRKVNNKSSEMDETLRVPRCITEPEGSYIYETFVEAAKAEDVKAYTVGQNFCHAETRKSPVVDGIVKRNPSGKELRYITELSPDEKEIAKRVVKAFGQTVCGFDLLRSDGKAYVIDVNGWSFVKDNNEYYDQCAKILRELFLAEKQRVDNKHQPQPRESVDTQQSDKASTQAKGSTSHRTLKEILKSPSKSKLASHHILGHHHHHHNSHKDPPSNSSPAVVEDKGDGALLEPTQDVPKGNLAIDPSQPPDTTARSRSPGQRSPIPPPASKAQWRLKGMVSVVRHADRTPKQKFKFTFHTKPFVDLLRGHQEEVLLVGEAALNSVLDAVYEAIREGKEDMQKLQLLRTSLVKKGGWPGTKVQIKPMFRPRRDSIPGEQQTAEMQEPAGEHAPDMEHRDSNQAVTLSRVTAAENNLVLDKLQLIIKWGGEPTHSARYQAQDLGENLRNDLLLMNRDCLEHVCVFSSSERRVTTSAQIFASAFLEDTNLSGDFIQVRKDLLDDSNAAKDEMDKVKKKLKQLLREGDAAPPEFAWPERHPEPFIVVRRVVELMKFHHVVMNANYQKLQGQPGGSAMSSVMKGSSGGSPTNSAKSTSPTGSMTSAQMVNNIQSRWCSGEDADLFRERWEKLFKEFTDADKVDPSKISELYDTLKFDALHNRQFLEWVFMPDMELDEGYPSEATTPDINSALRSAGDKTLPRSATQTTLGEKDAEKATGKDWKAIASRMGFRRPSEAEKPGTGTVPPSIAGKLGDSSSIESYFSLHKSPDSESKAKHDARLRKLRELYNHAKTLFDYIGPQEYGISPDEKLSIGLLTSLPLLKEIVHDLEEIQTSDGGSSFFYFTKESHIYTLLNCILEGGIVTKIARRNIPELDYLSQINFELYESENTIADADEAQGQERYNYSIRISISPGCHTFDPLDLTLDSKHCIGNAARRSLTAHGNYKETLETLRAKFHTVKLPKSFIAINLSEISPQLFGPVRKPSTHLDADDAEAALEMANVRRAGDADDVDAEELQLVQTAPN